jgi:DNA-3-methyladenine glycosylase
MRRGARQRTGAVHQLCVRNRSARRKLEATVSPGAALPRRFYERPAPRVARDLLGRVLVSRIGGRLTAGRIVETEAYLGPEDRASHAGFRPSSRWLFYGPGGIAYVFRAYGLNDCLNAIAGPRRTPGCVLIRALEPLTGIVTMARRRKRPVPDGQSPIPLAVLTSGPGRLTQALGITVGQNGHDLRRSPLRIHDAPSLRPVDIRTSTRVGITRSRHLRLRFSIRGSPFVSRPRA